MNVISLFDFMHVLQCIQLRIQEVDVCTQQYSSNIMRNSKLNQVLIALYCQFESDVLNVHEIYALITFLN